MSVFDRLFLMLVAVATTTACYPVTDVSQANPPSALTTSTPVLSALKQVSSRPPSPTEVISDLASSYPYPLETTKDLIGQWQTYGEGGGPQRVNIKPTKIELEILPDHTYSYDTPALQGYGLVEFLDFPPKHRYGKWRIEKNSYRLELWNDAGFWKACCICTTPEDEDYGGGCYPYILEGDKLTTEFRIFPVPYLGDVIYPIEWTRIR